MFRKVCQQGKQVAKIFTVIFFSANILDIPITSETDTNKLGTDATGGPVSSNNKTKTIVRKNNLIMEVT